ncbi:MAG TPA: 4-diphosphocytidyl-2C-methyl-D-erythritol kinase [Acidimicrobiia bacterium]|nr:4-diphosphocytidyl-2C-methyl-D-erythritol kinase [Acidimicrobiia bacterium]
MSVWEAPAKVNLSLELGPRQATGLHPLRSLVLCIDWNDVLHFEESDEDHLQVVGADLPDDGENLVWKAVSAIRRGSRPQLSIRLEKSIAVAAGLGGGSSDAAATLSAVADLTGRDSEAIRSAAVEVGADVALFLTGGLQWMEGYGDRLTRAKAIPDFALAVAVPPFELETARVYERWDYLDDPRGLEIEARRLPPSLRPLGPLRNDLTPAAIDLQPELADFIAELSGTWEQPVLMSGSGPALFGLFPDLGEAADAAAAVPSSYRQRHAAGPRANGVERID